MRGTHEDCTENDPYQRGTPAPVGRDTGSDDRRSAGDGGKMVPEQDMFVRRYEVAIVAMRVSRCY